jgi:hypothetical protein
MMVVKRIVMGEGFAPKIIPSGPPHPFFFVAGLSCPLPRGERANAALAWCAATVHCGSRHTVSSRKHSGEG